MENSSKNRINIILSKYPYYIDIFVGLLSSILLYIATSKYGLGITNDSTAYLSTSNNLWNGEGFFISKGVPFVSYAPLYPMILSVSNIFGIEAITFMMFFHIILYGILIALLMNWFRSLGNNGILLIFASLFLIGSRPIFLMSSMLWTEFIFIFCSTIFIIFLGRYIADPKSEKLNFAIATAAVMFACLTRYVGITLVVTGSLLLLIKKGSLTRRIIDMTLFGFLSSLPTGFFVLRNYWVTSTLVGNRYSSSRSFLEILSSTAFSITNLFIPDLFPKFLMNIGFLTIFIGLILVTIWSLKKTQDKPNLRGYIIASIAFILIYISYLVFSANVVGFDSLSTRFISPIYLPIILIILIFFTLIFNSDYMFENGRIYKNINKFKKPLITIILIGSLFMVSSVIYYCNYMYHNSPGGYASPDWQNSNTMEYSIDNLQDEILYSNEPCAFYNTPLAFKVDQVPRETHQASNERPDDLENFNTTLRIRGAVVFIWFDEEILDVIHYYIYSIDDFLEMYELIVIEELDDGKIYKVTFN